MSIWKKRSYILLIVTLFIAIRSNLGQMTTTTDFRPSSIQISMMIFAIIPRSRSSRLSVPDLAIIKQTSTTNFTCFNHQPSDQPLEVNLSKVIPTNEIQLFTNILNQSAVHIRLESRNYVGVFHLLCYSKGEQSKGNRADIIVTGKEMRTVSH